MKESEVNYLKKTLWVVIALFVLRCMIKFPQSLYECWGMATEAIAVGMFFMVVYEKSLWKYNPLEKIPKIYGKYSAILEHEVDESFQKKNITIIIEQSLLNVSIRIITDEITSKSITSNFICDNGEYVLYYTYITNPKSRYSTDNPMQYGTCRMTIQTNGLLAGKYWTTQKTKGDIVLKKKLKK